jgi:hypothetical protein
VILAPPDGDAAGAFADVALEGWSSWAHVAAFDLPLCATRRSDKLTADWVDPLRADLELQVAADLEALLERLGSELEPGACGFIALGLAAELALPFCESAPELDAFLLVPEPGPALLVERRPLADEVTECRIPNFDPATVVSALSSVLSGG